MRKNVVKGAVAALLSMLCSAAGGDQVYKCQTADGRLLYQKSPCAADGRTLSSWSKTYQALPPDQSAEEKPVSRPLTLKQHGSGHYFVEGAVNSKPLTFVIDTGASVVSLPDAAASAAGIGCEKEARMETANGMTEACTAVIPELRFGHFVIKNAQGMIVPNLSQPLLGMNVLKLFNMTQDRGEMRITAQRQP